MRWIKVNSKLRVHVSVVSVVLLCFRFSPLAITNLKLYLTLTPPLTETDMMNMFLFLNSQN